MTFPGTFWKPENPEIQVQIFEYLKKTSKILGPKSNFSDPKFGFSDTRFGFFRSEFRKKVLREPGSTRRKVDVSEMVQIDSNRSRELGNDLDSRFRGLEGRLDPKFPPMRFFSSSWTQMIPCVGEADAPSVHNPLCRPGDSIDAEQDILCVGA